MIDEMVEFENEKTGKTRVFPKVFFDALVRMVLQSFQPQDRERSEEKVAEMVASFLDGDDSGDILLLAAQALFPKRDGIRFNTYSPEEIKVRLQAWATTIFGRYGFPVYLVGSALTRGEGLDVDVRVILPDADFNARWPNAEGLDLELGKQGRIAALFSRTNIDFVIQSQSEARQYAGLPRLRLDACEYPEAKEPPESGIGVGG